MTEQLDTGFRVFVADGGWTLVEGFGQANMDPKVMESKESWLQCIVLSKILSSQIAASKGC